MTEVIRRPKTAKSEGFALCTPEGQLLDKTYRETRKSAIASMFAGEDWPARKDEGWTVEHVYARIFSPQFFADVIPEPIVPLPGDTGSAEKESSNA